MADGMQPSKLIRLNTKINSSSYPILIGKNIIKSLPKEILKFKKDSLKTGSSLIKEFLICES